LTLLRIRPERLCDNGRVFYVDLFRTLAAHDVRYVVVGGLALNLHGVQRATMDIDLALALDARNLGACVDAFAALALRPVAPVSLDDARSPATLQRWRVERHMLAFAVRPATGAGPTVDVLTTGDVPFDELAARAIVKHVGEVAIPVASIDDLIEMKRAAGRSVDVSDVAALEAVKRLGLGS
jgi:hypothetical protein